MFRSISRHTSLKVCAFLALCSTAAAQTDISGNLFDGSGGPLLAGQIYHVTGLVTVPSGQTLTVQAGAIVKFKASQRFDVAGALVVQGSPGNEVNFTSILDDSVGGDSAGDGATTGSAGDWEGLNILSSSTGSVIDHAVMRYAGAFSYAPIESNALDLTVRDCTMDDNLDSGIDLNSVAGTFTIERNAFLNGARYAVEAVNINSLPGFLDNTASGNALGDLIRVSSGSMAGSLVLGPRNGIDSSFDFSVLATVPAGETLQLEQGLVWKWESIGLRLDIKGTLITNGVASNPVVFTSGTDDDYGSDMFNDGPTSGTPGSWEGLNFTSTSTGSSLNHVLIRYSGAFNYSGIESNALDFALLDSVISEGSSSAIDLNLNVGAYQIERNQFSNCLRYAIERAHVDTVPGFLDNTASGNVLGDVVRIESGSMAGDLTLDPRNGLGDTIVTTVLLSNPAGATFQLNKGTILKFASNGLRIDVAGTLKSLGTLLEPVVFTSTADDEHGSDALNDGPTTGSAGQWEGINLLSSGTGSLIQYSLIRFGGAFGYSGIESHAPDFTLQNSIIESFSDNAINLNSIAGNYTIEQCTLRNSQRYAVENCHIDSIPGFRYNRANGNSLGNFQRVSSGTLSTDVTLKQENLLNGALVASAMLTVPAGLSLTLDPGVIIKPETTGIRLEVFGELHIQGTGRKPVIFTAFADDEYAGDTNLDGSSMAAPGAWEGIRTLSAEAVAIEHALIRYAGAFGFTGLDVSADSIEGDTASVCSTRVEYCSSKGMSLAGLTAPAANLIAFQNDDTGIETQGLINGISHVTSVGNGGIGIDETSQTSTSIKNSIAWGNLPANYSVLFPTDLVSCNGDPVAAGSNGNLFIDPLFVDETNGDLNLSASSPCQDSADFATAQAVATDFVENSRLLDPGLTGVLLADMGAYERSLWTISARGSTRLGGHLQHTVNGPSGVSTYFLGLLDGTVLSNPFGVVSAGTTSLSTLGSAPVGTPFKVLFPTDGALIGAEIGIQTLTVSQSNASVGAITQLVRFTLQPAVKVNPALNSL